MRLMIGMFNAVPGVPTAFTDSFAALGELLQAIENLRTIAHQPRTLEDSGRQNPATMT